MRTAFINQLIEEAKHNSNVFLLVGDLGFSVVEPFAELFPDRFVNVGVAEQNMAGIAAGLASEGYIPFIYSIGNFPTLRCMEQIRYLIAYHKRNVKIVAVGGGFAYGPLGASHHATEELGMIRSIPNMIVSAPGDPRETQIITQLAVSTDSPFYIRIGKAGESVVHSNLKANDYSIGDIIPVIQGGHKVAVLTTGSMLKSCLDEISSQYYDFSLFSVPVIKPLNKMQLAQICNQFERIITLEEHQLSSGFGSAITEVVNDLFEAGEILNFPKIKRIGIHDEFIHVAGSQNFLKKSTRLNLNNSF